ncbi:hypothetical protein ACFV1B_03570 [Streptomyces sp. NPDC059637]|uniref:hypothetical protein n=1 Tax=Streptomyces sp. NPDC059637 TaxID=3347752 RepID=UPI00367B1CB8
MNTPAKLGVFGAAVAVVFAGAFGVGHAVGPVGAPAPAGHTADGAPAHEPGSAKGGKKTDAEPPGGLQVSENGYTLALDENRLDAGRDRALSLRVLGPDGEPVTRFETVHDKKLHLVLATRDLSTYRHLHPSLDEDGTWSTSADLVKAGDYRVFADFTPDAPGAEPLTLGADLAVTGDYEPEAVPAASRTATVDDYEVTLTGGLEPGASGKVRLSVSKDGEPVTDLEPYLGAYGHLVALRAGDLAYLHVHPDGAPGDGTTPPGPAVAFHVEAPSAGTYRLYLDFKHDGKVRTAAFTAHAGAKPAAGAAAEAEKGTEKGGNDHGDGHAH